MEKKELQKRNSTIRSFFSLLNPFRTFFWRSSNSSSIKPDFLNRIPFTTLSKTFRSHFSHLTSSHSFQKGFTLVEIVTAIGVIAILATIALSAINPIEQFRKAQDTRRKNDLAQVQRALESYYQDFGRYPKHTTEGAFPYTVNTGDGEEENAISWGESWQPYIDIMPVDPNSDKFYVYWSDNSNGNQTYRIYASLDRGGLDPDVCNMGASCVNLPLDVSVCGLDEEACNYGVTSPNVSP